MKAKTARMTVTCPYCGSPYTFKSESNYVVYLGKAVKPPLHKECQAALKTANKRAAQGHPAYSE